MKKPAKSYKPINYPEDEHAAFEVTRRKAIMVRERMVSLADIGIEGRKLVDKQLDRELDKKIGRAEKS